VNILLRAATALFSILAGVLHWELWAHHGYDSTPVRELIIASAVLGGIVGSIAFVEKRRAALPAAAANAVFLVAFALSRVAELPTFHGGWSESGLAPDTATLAGISTTLLLVLAEAAAVACGVTSVFFGRDRPVALPASFARA
jgi:hypothetical protein